MTVELVGLDELLTDIKNKQLNKNISNCLWDVSIGHGNRLSKIANKLMQWNKISDSDKRIRLLIVGFTKLINVMNETNSTKFEITANNILYDLKGE